MALKRFQETFGSVQAGGDVFVLAGASVEVRDETSGALAAIFEDRAGNTAKANPFTTDSNGFGFFYAADGRYRVTATLSGETVDVRDVLLGVGATTVTTTTGEQSVIDALDQRAILVLTVEGLRTIAGAADGQVAVVATQRGGVFNANTSSTETDNDVTVFVDSDGIRWERVLDGVARADWFSESPATLYVSPTGDDANHGFTSGAPLLTVQAAADKLAALGKQRVGDFRIKLAPGTYTEGAVFENTGINNELLVEGELSGGAPAAVIDGATATQTTQGLVFSEYCNVRVRYVETSNFTNGAASSGIVITNASRGIIETCNAHNNTRIGFHCNQRSKMNIIGECHVGKLTEVGIQYRQTSGGTIGDGSNTVFIEDDSLQVGSAGVRVRDGSDITCNNNAININNKVRGFFAWKNAYAEIREATITNCSTAFDTDESSLVALEGPFTLTGNTTDYAFGNLSSELNARNRIVLNKQDNSARFFIDNVERYRMRADAFVPIADNAYSLGVGSLRWSTVYAATGTINTSDERQKQQVRELSDSERRAAMQLKGLVRAFKFNDAVEKKGDGARIHIGVLAQEVVDAFSTEGLDASRYGLLCYDEWEGQPVETDADGNIVKEHQSAGNRYGVRYEELLAFIISAI